MATSISAAATRRRWLIQTSPAWTREPLGPAGVAGSAPSGACAGIAPAGSSEESIANHDRNGERPRKSRTQVPQATISKARIRKRLREGA